LGEGENRRLHDVTFNFKTALWTKTVKSGNFCPRMQKSGRQLLFCNKKVTMAIRYYLKRNPFTSGETDHAAYISGNTVYDAESIIPELLRRGSTITEADVRAVLSVFYDVVGDLVSEGNHVNLPIANIKPRIAGIFPSATARFDPTVHTVTASLSPGKALSARLREAHPEKTTRAAALPEIHSFTDVKTQAMNVFLSPGFIGCIAGNELKFDPTNPAEGIYFIAVDGSETKVRDVAKRTKLALVFSIPEALSPGSYRLEVRKGYGTSAIVIRRSALERALIVE
jgi:hypothetical protein